MLVGRQALAGPHRQPEPGSCPVEREVEYAGDQRHTEEGAVRALHPLQLLDAAGRDRQAERAAAMTSKASSMTRCHGLHRCPRSAVSAVSTWSSRRRASDS
ncbi:hypothetical protein ADK61_26625 [Streptomyces sp. XY66]|nr:hypothetical protein ADK61_26625 [Streptomyces sp. XY66]